MKYLNFEIRKIFSGHGDGTLCSNSGLRQKNPKVEYSMVDSVSKQFFATLFFAEPILN